jgi:Xaa-Pro dipeptidase
MEQDIEKYFKNHLANIREQMQKYNVDIMFINKGTEFTYITGYPLAWHYAEMREWGDWIEGIIFSQDKDPVYVGGEHYLESPMHPFYNVTDMVIMKMDDPNPNATLKIALDLFEPANKTIAISKKTWGQAVLGLIEAAPSAKVVALADPIIDEARKVKDDYEISVMREAGKITSDVLESLTKSLKLGMTVHDVKAELSYQTLRRGSYNFSFSPGVICVNKDSDPKKRNDPTNQLTPQSTLAFDFGIVYQGYRTDFGRTLFVGEPQKEARKAYKVICDIVQEITTNLGEGKMTPSSMFHLGNTRAKEAGFYEGYGYYQWSIGHAIGTDLHEWPWLRDPHESALKPIKKGMIFAVEPKINGWGQYYLRCEDNILVGEAEGEVLTPFTYDPVIIG